MPFSATNKDSGHADFPTIKVVDSEIFYFNNDTVIGVNVKATDSVDPIGAINYYIGYSTTENGVYTYELLNRTGGELAETTHNFAASGVYFLKWRARLVGAASVITRLKIKVVR